MIFIYIIGIINFIFLSIIFIDKICHIDNHHNQMNNIKKQIDHTNDELDNLILNLGKTENLLMKVDNISKNIIKFRK